MLQNSRKTVGQCFSSSPVTLRIAVSGWVAAPSAGTLTRNRFPSFETAYLLGAPYRSTSTLPAIAVELTWTGLFRQKGSDLGNETAGSRVDVVCGLLVLSLDDCGATRACPPGRSSGAVLVTLADVAARYPNHVSATVSRLVPPPATSTASNVKNPAKHRPLLPRASDFQPWCSLRVAGHLYGPRKGLRPRCGGCGVLSCTSPDEDAHR